MRGNLDLLLRCRGDTLGTRCKLSESKVCQICCTHRACMLGKTGMFCLSESLHVPSIVYLGAKLLSNWSPFVGSPSVHKTDLRVAVGQPFGHSTNLPVNPTTFLIQQPCSQNDHGAVHSSRCHCRKQSDFPIKKNRDGVFVKGNVKFLPSFFQFHETAWILDE